MHNPARNRGVQVLSVVLLKGTMHYCKEEGAGPDDREPLDPYYLVPAGESIDKTWCVQALVNV